ncbi:hypothetical protein BKA66DRAFT_418317 [Pyrenochaeta sp. MPI-SDFR-AT-0127]|nr:hypothetical protein BKA66DRAFT_418317 [Pyrenochaeta sp. MPI-SDFR-AT-0127]
MRSSILNLAFVASAVLAAPQPVSNGTSIQEETRTLDELHQAALAEGGVVTLWHGGDEATQQNFLKTAFEARFPGMTLNVTVDLSKYHDGNLDQQIADGNVYVDSIILQTLHDYPRWKQEGVLLNYAPANFSTIHSNFKDADAAYMGLFIIAWGMISNVNKTNVVLAEYPDFLNPELKDKLVLTYPNDDDAILYQFDLIVKQYGLEWFDALIAQNPRWVRGSATPRTLLRSVNTSSVATFTSSIGLPLPAGATLPKEGKFVSWPQTGAILKDAPHPEGAKLLHNFLLSTEHQSVRGWSVREDLPAPVGFSKIWEQEGTNVTGFGEWMSDRANVERLKLWYESKLGTAQGLSPIVDDL